MGFSTSRRSGNLYIVTDQNSVTGGSWPGSNRITHRLRPSSSLPSGPVCWLA